MVAGIAIYYGPLLYKYPEYSGLVCTLARQLMWCCEFCPGYAETKSASTREAGPSTAIYYGLRLVSTAFQLGVVNVG